MMFLYKISSIYRCKFKIIRRIDVLQKWKKKSKSEFHLLIFIQKVNNEETLVDSQKSDVRNSFLRLAERRNFTTVNVRIPLLSKITGEKQGLGSSSIYWNENNKQNMLNGKQSLVLNDSNVWIAFQLLLFYTLYLTPCWPVALGVLLCMCEKGH